MFSCSVHFTPQHKMTWSIKEACYTAWFITSCRHWLRM